MNEAWKEQAAPLVHDLRRAFDNDTERWWQLGLRKYLIDSPRAREISADSQYAVPSQPAPVSDAYANGQLSLRFAQEYLWGAIDSILYKSIFPSFALARCSLEATARGYWLLEPDIEIKERLRREAKHYAQCLTEMRKMLNSTLQEALAAKAATLKAHEQENLDWARSNDLTDKTDTTAFANSCSSFTDLVGELISDMPEGGNVAPMVYRWLSGSAHSNPIVLQEFGQRVAFLGDHQNTLQMRASSGTAWFPIWWAARGLQVALNRLAHVNGWESPDDFLGPALVPIGNIVDSDVDLVTEVFDRPTVYREYLRDDQRA